MKPYLKKVISISILIIIIGLFAYYVSKHISDFAELKLANPWMIVLLAALTLISSTLTGMVTDSLVSVFGIKLKIREWFGLSITTTFYNMITPFRGGMVARAAYLKEKHGFPYTNFLAALAGTYVIDFLVASFLGLISLWLLFNQSGVFNWIVLAIFIAFFVPLLCIVIFSPRFPEVKNKWANRFIRVLNGWNLIRKSKRTILTSSTRAVLQMMIGTAAGIVSYGLFGIHITFAQALFLTTLGTFGILISITPAGLGIQEAIAVFSALVIGIGPAQSLPVALLGRAVGMIVIFTLGPIFSYILLKHKPNKIEKPNKTSKPR